MLIEWMDAVGPLWTGEDYSGQMFIDRWWWELFEALKYECLEGTPGMLFMKSEAKAKAWQQ